MEFINSVFIDLNLIEMGHGKKVKNPNGKGSGWPDSKGRVWIPDDYKGTHAPHYDVQDPKNGGYTTVYPE